jgi:hypothetical protein
MSRHILIALLPITMLMTACQKENPKLAGPIDPQQFPAIRDSYTKANTNARVGLVTAVLPDQRLAAVSNVPLNDFKVGDVITFVDANGKILDNGMVKAIGKNSLHVLYDAPGPGQFAPRVGDLGIRAIQ